MSDEEQKPFDDLKQIVEEIKSDLRRRNAGFGPEANEPCDDDITLDEILRRLRSNDEGDDEDGLAGAPVLKK